MFCQGPYEEGARYRNFMGWEMPWYWAQDSLDKLLVGREIGMMHIVCYLRQRSTATGACPRPKGRSETVAPPRRVREAVRRIAGVATASGQAMRKVRL